MVGLDSVLSVAWSFGVQLVLRGGLVVRWFWVNFQFRDVLLIWIIAWQGPTMLAVGAGGELFGRFFLLSTNSLFFLPLSRREPDKDSKGR